MDVMKIMVNGGSENAPNTQLARNGTQQRYREGGKLRYCAGGWNRKVWTLGVLILGLTAMGQQAEGQETHTIRGVVFEQEGLEPLVGATVYVKAQGNRRSAAPFVQTVSDTTAGAKGTYTDAKGEFTITTEKTLPLTLEVRSVGFKTKSVPIYQWEDTPVNIDLESKIGGSLCADRIRHHCRSQTDVTLLQNVLVIGYGTTTKEKSTGSSGSVDFETVKLGSSDASAASASSATQRPGNPAT